MVATERIAATKQVDLSYSPGGASVHPDFMHGFFGIRESPTSPNSISIGSAVFSRLTVVTTTHTHTRMLILTDEKSERVAIFCIIFYEVRAKNYIS